MQQFCIRDSMTHDVDQKTPIIHTNVRY